MKRGSPRDFWRSVKLGLQLSKWGWIPWLLEIDRRLLEGKLRLFASLHDRGCRTGVNVGSGDRRIDYLRGLSRFEDFLHMTRGLGEKVQLSVSARSRLIRKFLGWLRIHEPSGWSGQQVLFRLTRGFRAGGVSWRLFSDLYFYRREGLYWNNWLTSRSVGAATFRRLTRAGFYDRVREDLEGRGFRMSEPHPNGVLFDQDFLPSRILARKATDLLRRTP